MRQIRSFHGFCGQGAIVRALERHIAGALRQNLPLPHIAMRGESGMGKTALTRAVAKAMGTTCHEVYCGPETKRWQIAERLAHVRRADVVFLDEIHALKDGAQEVLYPAIDRCRVQAVQDGKLQENEWLEVPPFTIIVATDQPGKLTNALRQRIVLTFHLTRYCDPEMRVIVGNRASELGLLLSSQAITRLAEASRGIPRRAGHLLASLKTCVGDCEAAITRPQVRTHLEELGIDEDNLTREDRLYLAILAQNAGAHVSLDTIALRMGLDAQCVRRDVESYLAQHYGWVLIEPSGRRLSDSGLQHVAKRGLA